VNLASSAPFIASHAICNVSHPLDWTLEKQGLFVEACREMAYFHRKNNAVIKSIYDRENFDPNHLQTEGDLASLPFLGVTAMKHHLLLSLPPDKAVLKLTSSGTRGQKTQIWFDQDSLDRVQSMLDVYLAQEGLISPLPTNYIVCSYDPKDASDLGVSFTSRNQMRFAPIHEEFFAVQKDSNGVWQFRREAIVKQILDFQSQGLPLRILGMPAFIHELAGVLWEQKIRLQLHPASLILTGGGWKAAEKNALTREQFREMCTEVFSISPQNQRDAFGMAEHSAPYFTCSHHQFHVPVFNRLIIRDPVSLQPLPPDKSGLLQLVTPFNAMMPNLSILSTDWAMMHSKPCDCGKKSPTFQILGRSGLTKHKGCAIHAEDIVKRQKP
jgi:phenylacetate-coenzyme A ligase PaaK-like adenylate-forming protein